MIEVADEKTPDKCSDTEEQMIEALIYSLTEIKDINKIMIFVEGETLLTLPNSKKTLPSILDRNYGINKKDYAKLKETLRKDSLFIYTPLYLYILSFYYILK